MRRWCAVVPQKAFTAAKGRLEIEPGHRRALALAMLRDTVAALAESASVRVIVVVYDHPADASLVAGVHPVVARGIGLNASIEYGAVEARRRFPNHDIVVVPGDLPALHPRELDVCLGRAAQYCRSYLRDREGTGTTILTATGDSPVLPAYGPGSAAVHHTTGAHALHPDDVPSVRTDVDDLKSLSHALALGCGSHSLTQCALAGLVAEGVR